MKKGELNVIRGSGNVFRDLGKASADILQFKALLAADDLAAGKAMLRDYINATISFDQLARKLKKSSKSVHRMLGPRGNPTAETSSPSSKRSRRMSASTCR